MSVRQLLVWLVNCSKILVCAKWKEVELASKSPTSSKRLDIILYTIPNSNKKRFV